MSRFICLMILLLALHVQVCRGVLSAKVVSYLQKLTGEFDGHSGKLHVSVRTSTNVTGLGRVATC